MKIAFFTNTFLPNVDGVVTSVLNSSRCLVKRGHKVHIFTVTKNRKRKLILDKNIVAYYFKGLDLFSYPGFELALPDPDIIEKLSEINPDVIHIHTPCPLSMIAVVYAKSKGVPIVGTYHTLISEFLKYVPIPHFDKLRASKGIAWSYSRHFYNRCNVVIAPSLAIKNELRRRGIRRKIIALSNGVDLDKFKLKKVKKKEDCFLHVGRISYEKNIEEVIKAFNLLNKKDKKLKLIIAGKGPDLDELRKRYQSKNVNFLGRVNHKKLARLYNSCEVFVTASTIETEGLVILEAMACGLPVIGVNKFAIPEIVHHGKNGFVAKPHNLKEISSYMKKLIYNRRLREKFGKESLKIVEKYGLDRTVEGLERVYGGVVRG